MKQNKLLTHLNMNGFPRICFIYDRYKKASLSKKASVELRISYDYKQKYLNTGVTLYPREWKGGMVVNTPDAQLINQQLNRLLMDVRQALIDMSKDGYIDIFSIPNKLKKINSDVVRLPDFIRERTDIREYGRAKDTQERYERFIRLFNQWGVIKDFEDITEANIIAYDKYLKEQGMKDYSKWQNYHRFLNSFIIDAIEAGHMKRNPYRWLNIEKGKDSKGLNKCLTPDEFSRLKRVKLPTEALDHVRSLFVFQTYTCLSYTDLRDFDAQKIVTIKRMKVYTGKRDKTGKQFTIPLLSEPLAILKRYKGKLPIISNVKYNQYLKVIAQAAGIDKPISTHYARHTGATLLLNSGIDMQIVSKICGHSSTRITEQVYAKLLDETVVDAVSNLKI